MSKLNAYAFDETLLRLIISLTKVGSSLIELFNIIYGVPQRTILGISIEQIIPESESILSDISQCFMNNNLEANAGKFHLFLKP